MPDPADTYALGLDLGGTKIFAGLVDRAGNVRQSWRIPTPVDEGGPAILRALVEAVGTIRSNLSERERDRLVGVGVSSAGHINHRTGVVEYCTPNLPGWRGIRITEAIESAHRLPACADNDGNCAAYGEHWMGAGRGFQHLVALTLGTGLGGGIIADGRVVRGARGSGGEIGHAILVPDGLLCQCGQQGCAEVYVSGTALARASERSGLWTPAPTTHQLFEWGRAGDGQAMGLIERMAHHLATVLVTIINVLDPERIVLGGGVSEQGDLFLPTVRRELARQYGERGWDPGQLVLAQLGEHASMIGAAGEAFERFGTPAAVAVR